MESVLRDGSVICIFYDWLLHIQDIRMRGEGFRLHHIQDAWEGRGMEAFAAHPGKYRAWDQQKLQVGVKWPNWFDTWTHVQCTAPWLQPKTSLSSGIRAKRKSFTNLVSNEWTFTGLSSKIYGSGCDFYKSQNATFVATSTTFCVCTHKWVSK